MALKEAVQNEDWSGLSDEEVVTAFNADVELSRDTTSYLWGGLNIKLLEKGIDSALVATWDQLIVDLPGGPMMGEMLRSGGVDLSLDAVRVPLQAAVGLGDSDADTLLNALLSIGITIGKKWELSALEALPTEAEVNAARVTIQNEQDVASLLNEVINPMSVDGSTVAEIKSAVAEWSV